MNTTSRVTAAAGAPPPVDRTHLTASWCGYGSTYIHCIQPHAILDARRDYQVNMQRSSEYSASNNMIFIYK